MQEKRDAEYGRKPFRKRSGGTGQIQGDIKMDLRKHVLRMDGSVSGSSLWL
jgi:hypothetical protein